MVQRMTWMEFKKRWELFGEGVANDFVTELARAAPVDTGFLRNSIGYRKKGKGFEVYMADYALYVEFGTPPHVIKPRNKKALHWTEGKGGGGEQYFAKIVHHPGTRPQPFIRNTIMTKLKNIIIRNLKRQYGE